MSAEPKMPEPVAYIAAIKAQRLGQKIPMMTTLSCLLEFEPTPSVCHPF